MANEFVETLRWSGAQAVRRAAELVSAGQPVAIELPPGWHHALCVRLQTGTTPPTVLDVSGGSELLEQLPEIRASDAFAALLEAMESVGATVRLTSPTPKVSILPH